MPTINSYFQLISEDIGNENRTKQKRPEFDISKLDSYVKDFDTYYSDNFSLRNEAIETYNKLEYKLLGVSPVPNKVVLGKKGWFYDKDNIANYNGSNSFTKDEIILLRNELAYRAKWAIKQNINYFIVIVPNKMNVYPEYLPEKIIKTSHTTRYNQIVSLDKKDGIHVIDLRKNLLRHKKDGYDLYQHTDGHWNELGAYFGYQEILNNLSEFFPDMKPIPLKNYSIVIEKRKGGSIVSMINMEKEYSENFVKLIEKNKSRVYDGIKRSYKRPEIIPEWDHQIIKLNDSKKLKCLIIRDSFTLLLIKYLQEHFKETVFIHDEWKYRMREDIIANEKPDIILNIILENNINKLIEFPFNK